VVYEKMCKCSKPEENRQADVELPLVATDDVFEGKRDLSPSIL